MYNDLYGGTLQKGTSRWRGRTTMHTKEHGGKVRGDGSVGLCTGRMNSMKRYATPSSVEIDAYGGTRRKGTSRWRGRTSMRTVKHGGKVRGDGGDGQRDVHRPAERRKIN